MTDLPAWAGRMRDLFRAGAVAQFVLHGNVFDVVPDPDGTQRSLASFLNEVMFGSYDVVLHYDRSRGLHAARGGDDFGTWLDQTLGSAAGLSQTREPAAALELLDRYLLRTLNRQAFGDAGAPPPRRIAVVIHFAEFVAPRGDALQLGGAFAANVVKLLGWANDPAILQSNIITVLVSEGLNDLNQLVVENPHAATLEIPLPDETDTQAYLETLSKGEMPELTTRSDVPLPQLAARLTGLSRGGVRKVLATAMAGGDRITPAWLSSRKKEAIERECHGLLEFLESPLTLDNVAGQDAIKAWLREDTELLRRGVVRALPMGYLISGRIGTGKTFLVQCWAGELGIPCAVLKNFRDRWVGATEANLEKIFAVLRALGQVLVFVDEADQAAGKREGGGDDGGLSGRVYSMLAKEMSDTGNRGRIIWVFATSRPDLVEVDLKRQGRLDVHIPLFPPESAAEKHALLRGIARKLGVDLADGDVPALPDGIGLGSNELEGVLVRALRIVALANPPGPALRDVLAQVLAEVRPSAFTRKLEYMDYVAVKECTDARFLPARYRDLTPEMIEERIAALRSFV